MYLTITDLKSDVPIKLYQPLDNTKGTKTVTLCEMTYSFNWTNISSDKKNNLVTVISKATPPKEVHITIPDGYYDFCTLDKIIFKPYKIEATLNPANLRVTLSFPTDKDLSIESITFSPGLDKLLGFGDGKCRKIIKKTRWIRGAISNQLVSKPTSLYLSQ